MQADWKQQSLRLLAPARIDAADGVAVDNLRLGLQKAVLTVSGKAGSSLDLTATLRDLPADMRPSSRRSSRQRHDLADARLTRTSARPTARSASCAARSCAVAGSSDPAANLTAQAALTRGSAHIDARLAAGSSNLTVTAPRRFCRRSLDLRTTGLVDLGMIEPLMAASGRRVVAG